ncbi:hypothetical protein M404DRAFT_736632 [Pisolithus tinctorius Marx 270]|uniref:Uncharacterized protein n=1 Tax=Pisolithus tinctorius Marx 270 TaxID=870435 RepID=A0A0C3NJJ4_PISTI|nr:hypothetical protein M404DRAFT_736632 [Pisolithus tinctorius Marx 270]
MNGSQRGVYIRKSEGRDSETGEICGKVFRGRGRGRRSHDNSWGDRHETVGPRRGPPGESGTKGTTPIEAPNLEIFTRLPRRPMNAKTAISQQRLCRMPQTRSRQEGFVEESVRPKKRGTRWRNEQGARGSSRVHPPTTCRIYLEPLGTSKRSRYRWRALVKQYNRAEKREARR